LAVRNPRKNSFYVSKSDADSGLAKLLALQLLNRDVALGEVAWRAVLPQKFSR
jgi:hypothetical protein